MTRHNPRYLALWLSYRRGRERICGYALTFPDGSAGCLRRGKCVFIGWGNKLGKRKGKGGRVSLAPGKIVIEIRT